MTLQVELVESLLSIASDLRDGRYGSGDDIDLLALEEDLLEIIPKE
jgi:hypothetical protein